MVALDTSEEWQRQTSLLLQARPNTYQTRITTKYNIPNLDSTKYAYPKKRKRDAADADDKEASGAPRVPRATLTLKTYDPESGVVLKFKTDRAAEVGRLVGNLGRMGRHMAALPEEEEIQDIPMEDASLLEKAVETVKEALPPSDAKPQQQGAGGGTKKKKNKNKK